MGRARRNIKKAAKPAALALMMAAVVFAIPAVLVVRVAMMPIKGLGEPK